MADKVKNRNRRKERLAGIHEMLEQSFPEVERTGTTRFLVWGSTRFKHRPYLEIWFDNDFLDQENNDLLECNQRIVSEAEAILSNPDQGIRKQGEILVSGSNGITARRGVHIYRLHGAPQVSNTIEWIRNE